MTEPAGENRILSGFEQQLDIFSGCSAVGSALALGARCRRFESCHSDQKRENDPCGCFLFFAWCVNSKLLCVAQAGSHTEGITKRSVVTLSFRPKGLYSHRMEAFSFWSDSRLRCMLRIPNLVCYSADGHAELTQCCIPTKRSLFTSNGGFFFLVRFQASMYATHTESCLLLVGRTRRMTQYTASGMHHRTKCGGYHQPFGLYSITA